MTNPKAPGFHPPIEASDDEVTDPGLLTREKKASALPATPRVEVKMPDLGPLAPLLKDPSITEIMVNDLRNVFVERDGRMFITPIHFSSVEEVQRITRNITDLSGRIVSPDQPFVDVMLPDGSRANIVTQPLTLYGPCITIRRFPKRLSAQHLLENSTLDQRILQFLTSAVQARLNLVISGGTGSGKTSLLNALAQYIPPTERIVVIEDTPELLLGQPNHVKMQTRPLSPTLPAIGTRELLANALRMRPDRILVGECRRSEAIDMLQAMNTGHDGSMTTVHANTPRDALYRLETLCLLSETEIPLSAIRRQIASAVDLLVQLKRFRDGSRRIIQVTEITGIEGEILTLQDIYSFDEQEGFRSSGFMPKSISKFRERGIELSRDLF
jgi:pilus assembly protein CpaF